METLRPQSRDMKFPSKFPLTSVVCQAPRAEIARQFIIRLRWPLTKRSQLGGQGESRKDIRFEAEKEDTHHGDFFNSLREISLGVQFVLWMAPPPPPAHSLRECAFLQVEDTYTLHAFKVKECVFRSPSWEDTLHCAGCLNASEMSHSQINQKWYCFNVILVCYGPMSQHLRFDTTW